MEQTSLTDRINAALPQTQCTKCGYQGCRPYAEAIAAGEAINRCPPGGPQTITVLAELTGQPAQPLNPEVGQHVPLQRAVIREDECIGCTKCITACPVDAIVGAAKLMHTVIASDCTGCDLCVEPCPVDCIDMITVGTEIEPPSRAQAQEWQLRYEQRKARLTREADAHEARRQLRLQEKLATLDRGEQLQKDSIVNSPWAKSPEQLRAEIMAAVARKKGGKGDGGI
ncbi:electron transport complex subunit RsxB [Pseudohongiella sp. SYSU M77423]|uniref:electron transport complex subunit RsxB n=1 Tax=Pseudohongiella sp. SYSU M77423 TaxID=3042312 RepID=UPI00247FFB8E|nr:electron transport complex subunit RsxB [Pseudohongiella sp. SYSU M77423]MDH7942963.1 electron transport complex subunit RsxB [Pseudohongiella sp. SYSU M77423]